VIVTEELAVLTYLDSSLLVSIHGLDGNSMLASTAFTSISQMPVITTLCQLEVINALNLRAFRKQITARAVVEAIRGFEEDLLSGVYEVRTIPEGSFVRALELSQKTTQRLGTRSSDILHVAAALELGAKAFYSFDLQQRKLAESLGLTLNPI